MTKGRGEFFIGTDQSHTRTLPASYGERRGEVKREKQMTEWEEWVLGQITRAAKTGKCEARWTRRSWNSEDRWKQSEVAGSAFSDDQVWFLIQGLMVSLKTSSYHAALNRYLMTKFNHCVTHTRWLLPFPSSSLCIDASQYVNHYTTLLIDWPLICSPLVLFNKGS